jgi:nicotinamide-nucleotide amidase
MTHALEQLAFKLGHYLKQREWKLATAESCTGGGLAYIITEVAGSSAWFERGFVTYSNSAKHELLGVNLSTLQAFGAVSEQTVREMAEGALQQSEAQISLAITGVAGPSGGSPDKPVGTVWFGLAGIGIETQSILKNFSGNRHVVREQAIQFALEICLSRLSE